MLRKKGVQYLIVCMIGLLLSATLVWAQRNYSVMQYDMVIKQSGNVLSTAKVYVKDNRIRMETNNADMESITIFDGIKAYMYIPAQNMAMAVPVGQAKAQLPETGDYQKDCEYLGEETVEGKMCGVYNCAKKGKSFKMWLDKTIEFPVKTESEGVEMYFKNVKTDVSLDDSLFSLPSDVKIQDMPNLMQK